MSNENGHSYRFESFDLDVEERQLTRDGSRVSLTPKAFDVLTVLVSRAGHLVSKEELLDIVWADSFVEEVNVARIVHMLRRALGEDDKSNKFIETVPKKGYRFVADVTATATDSDKSVPPRPHPATEPGARAIVNLKEWDDLGNNGKSSGEAGDIAAEESKGQDPRWRTGGKYWLPLLAALLIVPALFGALYLTGQIGSAVDKNGHSLAGAQRERSLGYDLYVRGKVRVASENREDTEAAIKLLEEAVSIDPSYAEAYAQLARGYNTMAFKYSSDADRERFHENAEVAIEKALALDPDLAEAHFARGLILWTNTRGFPHESSIQSYKRSLSLDPNSDETHHQLGLVYSHIGLLDEAERSISSALELNPNNTLARFRKGVNIAYQGKFDEAIAVYKTIPRDFTPLIVDRSLAEALIQSGRTEEAGKIVDDYLGRFPKDEGGSFHSVKALLLAKDGKHGEAITAIQRAIEIGRDFGHFHHTAYNVASAYAAMKMPDEAVRWLQDASDGGFPNYPYFEVDPNLDVLKRHPGYLEFMSKLRPRWERFKSQTQ